MNGPGMTFTERLHGIQEVVGSIPSISTSYIGLQARFGLPVWAHDKHMRFRAATFLVTSTCHAERPTGVKPWTEANVSVQRAQLSREVRGTEAQGKPRWPFWLATPPTTDPSRGGR